MCWRNFAVPISGNGDGQPDIGQTNTNSVADIKEDEEPADPSKPLLYEDAMVEQNQRYPRKWVANRVKNVERVLGLLPRS